MNIIGDQTSYKCNIFQIMILQLHDNRWEGAPWTPRWKVWLFIRPQFHLTKHSTRIGSNQIAIKSMASDDNDRWVEERPVEIKFIVLVFFLGGFNFPRAALPPQNL